MLFTKSTKKRSFWSHQNNKLNPDEERGLIFSPWPDLEKIKQSNQKYKQHADKGRRNVLFDVGTHVWAVLTRDRFPVGEYNKLSAPKKYQ